MKLKWWKLMLAIVLAAGILPLGAYAEEEPVWYQQLHEEFDQGMMAWTVKNGAAKVTDEGKLLLQNTTGTNEVVLKGNGAVWGNQILSLTFNRKEVQGSNFSSVVMRSGNGDQFMILIRDSMISYKLGSNPEAALASYTVARNTDYDLRVVLKNSTAVIQIKKSTDSAFSNVGTVNGITAQKGILKLYTYQAATEFDHIRIYNDEEQGLLLKNKVLLGAPGSSVNLDLLNTTGQPVVWSSSDSSIVTVNSSGQASVLKKGNATVTATTLDGTVSDTCEIVGVTLLTGIAFARANLVIEEGKSTNQGITYTPSAADNKNLIWSIADDQIAELVGQASKARGVKGKQAGTTTITARTPDGQIQAQSTVTVIPAPAVQPSSAHFAEEGTAREIPFGIYGMHFTQVNRINSWTTFNPSYVLDFMRDLKIQSLRGPDGTPSNYFMAKEGLTMSTTDPRYAGFYGTKSAGVDHYSYLKPGFSALWPEDIYYAANDLEIPYLYCINVSSQSVQDILDILEDIKEVTDAPINLELGNELYDTYGMLPFVTVDDYMDKVKDIYTAVKAVYPDTKIGAVILNRPMEQRIVNDPNNQPGEDENQDWGSTFLGRIYNWNSTIAANPGYYDAVIPHDYSNLVSVTGLSADDVMAHLSTYTKETYEGFMEQAAQFPGKEMWVSEWGALPEILFSESDAGEKARLQMMRTPGFAIHYMERLLTMIETGVIQYSSYHTLSDGQGFGIVSGQDIFPGYYTFRGVGQILEENNYFYPLNMTQGVTNEYKLRFTNEEVYHDVEEVGAWGFGTEQELSKAVFINRTRNPVTVGLDGAELKSVWEYGNGADPLPDFAVAPFATFRDLPTVNPEPVIPQSAFAGTVTIPPYTALIAEVRAQ